MAYLIDTPIVLINNGLLFKNNIEYIQAKFIQDSKITKRLIGMFFNNLDLAFMPKYLNYKNVDKMKALLTKLPYDKIT